MTIEIFLFDSIFIKLENSCLAHSDQQKILFNVKITITFVFYFLSTATEYYTVSVRLNHIITYTNNSLFKCQIVVTKITHEEKAERENKQKADSSE